MKQPARGAWAQSHYGIGTTGRANARMLDYDLEADVCDRVQHTK